MALVYVNICEQYIADPVVEPNPLVCEMSSRFLIKLECSDYSLLEVFLARIITAIYGTNKTKYSGLHLWQWCSYIKRATTYCVAPTHPYARTHTPACIQTHTQQKKARSLWPRDFKASRFNRNKILLGTKGIATRSKKLVVAPGITTSNKKLLGWRSLVETFQVRPGSPSIGVSESHGIMCFT